MTCASISLSGAAGAACSADAIPGIIKDEKPAAKTH
jgi:hypothetical protein